MSEKSLIIRSAIKSDTNIIAEHLCHIALGLGLPSDSIRQDWLEKTTKFIDYACKELRYKSFIAEVMGETVGSASCQLLELYPMVSEAYQKGYIWGVYVKPAYRRQGIATTLMKQAMLYLKGIGCTKAVLHASDQGRMLYTRLGYVDSNEMVLNLD
ncbi:gcn5-related n-acetyltransferase [Leptolyngbya sp. Heron Island J]|uniref:GNAT family N-acetyltransferase n=1 Tax=Leptolyngbya sp. Heron Island J TaxID=1385935 RepID=UPI0003B9C408|nr:GNAT family N-acetyltransferase [Leptolyngbya sp. Heron Island J]ESA37026.1 gcn5-related n-acetyltransferase [Leptolyngbya sp. Heron Island J]